MGKVYQAAMYPRLSREDGDNVESESIVNQKDFIRNYVSKQDDIILIDYDYSDDGYTGGNFDRPGWNKLMKDIEDKKIDTIITKDLSRMGRDYISMGEYIERIFPEKGIRYIAINDDVDTLYETPGLDFLQFKLVFNDYYLKDTSKKIKKTMRSKKEQGQYTGWKGIYGYKRDPNDKHKLIVDEEVRNIVIRMFNLAKQGYGTRGIADIFTKEGILNPSTYANLIRGTKTQTSKFWCPRTIDELLQNPTYIGHLTQGRRKKVSYKSKKEIRVPKEDWIIIKNTHEPIIDEETFNTVQDLLQKNKNDPQNKNDHLLKGFLYCKECGHSIGINTSSDKKRKYCVCCYYTAHSKFGLCTPHSMNYDKLETAVLEELRKMCKEYIDVTTFESKVNEEKRKNNQQDKLKRELSKIDLKINQVNNYIDKSYVDKMDGFITAEQYQRVTLKFKGELEELSSKKQELEKEISNIGDEDIKKEAEMTVKQMKEFLSLKNPSRELLVNLIDKIVISEDKTVEINYKFRLL